MSIKASTLRLLGIALTSTSAAKDLASAAGGSLSGSAPAATTPVAVTYTASADTYTAIGSLTIAAGATPTVVELLHYLKEHQKQITAIQSALTARGITL